MTNDLLTVAEVAKRLRCKRHLIYGLIRRGDLDAIDLTRGKRASYRISEQALSEFLAASEVESTEPAAAKRKPFKPRLAKPRFLKVS
ncbi:MAG: helix-turn-helix domain-containing protein [Novipirellula sp. JB048]